MDARPVLLLTGFGPFPGVPRNPSADVVDRIAAGPLGRRLGIRIVTHLFETSYTSLAGLEPLVARVRPDAALHLGIAARSRYFRIETRATNFAAPFLPDATGRAPERAVIEPAAGRFRPATFPARAIRARIAAAGLPAELSRSAGRYLCNVLLWQALALAERDRSGRMVGFLHLPPSTGAFDQRRPRRPGRSRPVFTPHDLVRATERTIEAMVERLGRRSRGGEAGWSSRHVDEAFGTNS